MCGIVCYLGSERKTAYLIDKLKRLEYRGYDSAGYSSLIKNAFYTQKVVGKLENLEKLIKNDEKSTCLISHTRWATHGECNKINAHPHLSKNNFWAVVHNGIIENYISIKKQLKNQPQSTTDTAVVAELLEERNPKSLEEFVDVFKEIKGSYALVALSKNEDNTMYFAKNKSPMFIGVSGEDFMIASDPICFSGFAKEYIIVEDGEFGIIKNKKILILNSKKIQIKKQIQKLEIEFENSSKAGYPHFMLKEIMEEAGALENQVKTFLSRKILKPFSKSFIDEFDRIVFVGCGTAYHAGLMGTHYVKEILQKNADAYISSEFLCEKDTFLDKKALYIFISQSGETADTLLALEKVKKLKIPTIALTNVMYSTISRRADYVLPTCAGKEIAVASTKAYICQLSAIYMFCKNAKYECFDEKNACYFEINNISKKINNFDREKIKNLANLISTKQECVFIGKALDYVTSLECSLKLKEVSYINSCAYPSGELKHGYLAMITKETPLFAFATNEKFNLKTISSAEEALARGAMVFVITSSKEFANSNQNVIYIDEQNPLLSPLLASSVMQYLVYNVSINKNLNPDMPRNLAKSVTVE